MCSTGQNCLREAIKEQGMQDVLYSSKAALA
jgi:hypothetical protein